MLDVLQRGWGPALACSVLLLAVYARTLMPGVGLGDSAKFQFVGWVWGTPHPTGYPTYLVLNHLFLAAVPFGSLAWRANLLSAVFAAAAVALMGRLLVGLGVRPWVGALAALGFGLTPTLWSQAVVAEVYTLNLLFVVGVTHLFLRWRRSGERRHFYAACALYALSFGCHLTMVTLLPAVAAWVWTTERKLLWDVRAVLAVLGLVALGAAQYAYILVRAKAPGVPYEEMAAANMGQFWWSVTGAGFKAWMFKFTPRQLLTERLPMYAGLLMRNLGPLLLLVPAGVAALWGRGKGPWLFLVLGALGNVGYSINYGIVDIEVYFIPSYFFLAVLGTVGLAALVGRWRSVPKGVAEAAAAVLALGFGVANFARSDMSGRRDGEQATRPLLDAAGTDAVLLSSNYLVSEALWYYTLGEGLGVSRRLTVVHEPAPEAVAAYLTRGRQLRAGPHAIAPGRRVFTADDTLVQPLEAQGLRLASRGAGVWEVMAQGPAAPAER